MLPVHVSRAVGPPSGSGWLSGIVPWKVKPHAHAVRREPQLPTIARQWTRRERLAPAAGLEAVAAHEPHGPGHDTVPARVGVQPETELADRGGRAGAQVDRAGEPRLPGRVGPLDGPRTHAARLAPRGAVALDPGQRVVTGVAARDRGPALAVGVEALLDDRVGVVRGVRAQGDDAVGQLGRRAVSVFTGTTLAGALVAAATGLSGAVAQTGRERALERGWTGPACRLTGPKARIADRRVAGT